MTVLRFLWRRMVAMWNQEAVMTEFDGEGLRTLAAALCISAAGAHSKSHADQLEIGATYYDACLNGFGGVPTSEIVQSWLADICKVDPAKLRRNPDGPKRR